MLSLFTSSCSLLLVHFFLFTSSLHSFTLLLHFTSSSSLHFFFSTSSSSLLLRQGGIGAILGRFFTPRRGDVVLKDQTYVDKFVPSADAAQVAPATLSFPPPPPTTPQKSPRSTPTKPQRRCRADSGSILFVCVTAYPRRHARPHTHAHMCTHAHKPSL